MNNKKRAWLYCQVGCSEYANAILEIQKYELQNFANREGCTVVGISTDICSSRYLDRQGLKQMLGAAQHGGFDVLLVAQYENICCEYEPMTAYLCQLQALGLDICAPNKGSVKIYDDFRIDADTADSSEE